MLFWLSLSFVDSIQWLFDQLRSFGIHSAQRNIEDEEKHDYRTQIFWTVLGIAEEWPSYVERLQFYLAANDVDGDRKKRAILLSCCGSATYSLFRSLVVRSKPDEVSLQAIIDKVNAHYNPRPSAIIQRFKFNSRSQQPGESLPTYVAELRKLSEFCEYGDQLDQMLRDRLVCGIADTH